DAIAQWTRGQIKALKPALTRRTAIILAGCSDGKFVPAHLQVENERRGLGPRNAHHQRVIGSKPPRWSRRSRTTTSSATLCLAATPLVAVRGAWALPSVFSTASP